MSTPTIAPTSDGAGLEIDPQVALRPEPFGALAYHHGTRRLVFLKHPDLVHVVERLGDHPSLAAALAAIGIAPERHVAFERAIAGLLESGIVRRRAGADDAR